MYRRSRFGARSTTLAALALAVGAGSVVWACYGQQSSTEIVPTDASAPAIVEAATADAQAMRDACQLFFDQTGGHLLRDVVLFEPRWTTPDVSRLDAVLAAEIRAWAISDCVELMSLAGSDVTPASVASCASKGVTPSLPRAGTVSPVSSCSERPTNVVPDGTPCSVDVECATDSHAPEFCEGASWSPNGARVCGRCMARNPAGYGCSANCGYYGNAVCEDCEPGLFCDLGVSASSLGTCRADPPVGDGGAGDRCGSCAAGLHCNASSPDYVPDASYTCEGPLPDGAECHNGRSAWCAPDEFCPGWDVVVEVPGHCAPRHAEGDLCAQDPDCLPGLVCPRWKGRCSRPPPDADALLPGAACDVGGSPSCFFGSCAGNPAACPQVVDDGAPCGDPTTVCGPVSACNPQTHVCERLHWACTP